MMVGRRVVDVGLEFVSFKIQLGIKHVKMMVEFTIKQCMNTKLNDRDSPQHPEQIARRYSDTDLEFIGIKHARHRRGTLRSGRRRINRTR